MSQQFPTVDCAAMSDSQMCTEPLCGSEGSFNPDGNGCKGSVKPQYTNICAGYNASEGGDWISWTSRNADYISHAVCANNDEWGAPFKPFPESCPEGSVMINAFNPSISSYVTACRTMQPSTDWMPVGLKSLFTNIPGCNAVIDSQTGVITCTIGNDPSCAGNPNDNCVAGNPYAYVPCSMHSCNAYQADSGAPGTSICSAVYGSDWQQDALFTGFCVNVQDASNPQRRFLPLQCPADMSMVNYAPSGSTKSHAYCV